MVMPGFSDSHWFRQAFDATAYGFCPQSGMTLTEVEPLVHGADERIKVSDVELAARFFFEIVPEVLT
jgi:acetylornithine deacetylase/succinyl-diaminopimelate desuccinylase-like protein